MAGGLGGGFRRHSQGHRSLSPLGSNQIWAFYGLFEAISSRRGEPKPTPHMPTTAGFCRAHLQEILLQQGEPQALPHLHRAPLVPLLPTTKPAAEPPPTQNITGSSLLTSLRCGGPPSAPPLCYTEGLSPTLLLLPCYKREMWGCPVAFGVLTSSFEPFVSTTPRQDSSKPQLCVQGM